MWRNGLAQPKSFASRLLTSLAPLRQAERRPARIVPLNAYRRLTSRGVPRWTEKRGGGVVALAGLANRLLPTGPFPRTPAPFLVLQVCLPSEIPHGQARFSGLERLGGSNVSQ
jgi:hypothetical protein